MLFTRRWWLITRNRAARSTAAGFLLSVGASVPGWMALNWVHVAYYTIGSGVVSFAMAIASSPVPKEDQE